MSESTFSNLAVGESRCVTATEIGPYELFIKRVANGWIVDRRQKTEPVDWVNTVCRWNDTWVFNDIERLQVELPTLLGIPIQHPKIKCS